MSNLIRSLNIVSQGLSNKITWTKKENVSPSFTCKIWKHLPGPNNLFDISSGLVTVYSPAQPPNNPSYIPIDAGTYTDYDISQNFNYRYELEFTQLSPTETYKTSGYCITFSGLIDGGSVNYLYPTNKFKLNWNDSNIVNNKDPSSNYTYDIFVLAEPKPSSWPNDTIQFSKSNTDPSYNIISNSTTDITVQTRDFVINTKYTFYVSPSYTSSPDGINSFNRGFSIDRKPNILGSFSLFPPGITNLSIISPYNNNKISFSWKNITNPIPSNYNITLKKNNIVVSGFPITTTENNFILDNTDFIYSPDSYTIHVSVNYYGLETDKTSLNFTIPVTPISLTVQPLNNLGQVTNDYKNISSIQLNWTSFSYTNIYYKIKVKIVNKDGVSEPDLFFYTTTTNYTFPINSNTQVEFKFSVSYSVDIYSPSSDNWPYGPQPFATFPSPIMTIEAMTNDGNVANGSQTSDSYLDLKFTSTELTSTFESEDIVLSNNVPVQYTTSSNYIPQNGIASMIYVFKVTVQEVDGNNYFCINGIKNPELKVYWNRYFIFDQSDSSNEGHPFSVKIYNPAESGFGDRGSYHGTPGSENSFWIFSQSETPGGTYVYDTENNYSGEGVWKSRISTDNLMGNNIRVSGDPVMQGGNPIYTSDDITPTNVFRQQLRTTQAGTYTIDINANSFKSTTGLDNTASTQFSWTRNQ